MNTQTKIKLNLFKILDESIDTECYTDKEFKTLAEKAQFALDCFEKEYECNFAKSQQPNRYQRIASYLAGLPTVCTIPFTYHDILKIGYDLGMIKKEKQEDAFLEDWFNLMAGKLVQASKMKDHAEMTFKNFIEG